LIARGDLGEGALLPPEAALMTELSVSRGTLREAFRVLESESLISVQRGAAGGARVHLPTEDVAARHASFVLQLRGTTVAEVLEARALFEPPVAALVARKRTNAQLARLRSLAEEEAGLKVDPSAEAETMRDFHRELIEASGNRALVFLGSMIDRIVSRSAENWAESTSPSARRSKIAKLHQDHVELVDLIAAKDSEGAAELWRRHLAVPRRASERRPVSDLFL
jgi:DNA-binding FadR family transcriptional regulator